jgi:predicted HicB family RNase H-like nuclease
VSSYLHYKEYTGIVEFSEDDNIFHGKVIGIKSLISFEGDTVYALTKDFHQAVDEYAAFCAKNNLQPEKPYKGSFNVRVAADIHRKAAFFALARGISLNAFVEDALRQSIEKMSVTAKLH